MAPHYFSDEEANNSVIISPDESRGYLGFSMVTHPLPQIFPFGRDNLKIILFCDLDLQFQGQWWPLFTFGPVLIYRKLDHSMAGIYNTYICPE